MRIHARKIFTHSVLYGASNVAAVIPGVVLVPIYTRYLTPEAFGAFAVITTYGTFLVYLLDLGLTTALVRRYYDYTDEDVDGRRRLVSTATWILTIATLLIAGAVALGAAPVTRLLVGDYPAAAAVRLMTAAVGATTLAAVPMTVLRVSERPATYFQLSVVKGAGTLVLVSLLVVWLQKGITGIFAAQLAVGLLVTAVGWTITSGQYALTFSRRDCSALLGMGLAFWPTMMLNWVIDSSDFYFLRHYDGLAQVAIYAVAYKVAQIVFYVVLAFSIGWSPILFGILRDPDPEAVLARLFRFYVVGLVSFAFALALAAPQILWLLGPSAYAKAAPVAAVLCAAYVAYGLFVYVLAGVVIAGKFQFQTLALCGGALVNTGLNVLLIPRFGMWGAAVSTLVAFAATAALGLRFAQRLFPIPYRWGDALRIVVALGGGVAAYAAIPAAGFDRIAGQVAAVLTYIALLFATGAVSPRDVRSVTALLPSPEPAIQR